MTRRSGITLVELLVALAILGLMTAVVAVQFQPARPASNDWRADSVAAMRRRAITEGRVRTAILAGDSTGAHPVTALPDGRVLADSIMDIDPFTGRQHEAR